MNGKHAKRLRRAAEKVTVCAPEKNYVVHVHPRLVQTDMGLKRIDRHTVKLVECTRGAYQHMKADYRRGIKAVME